MFNLKNYLKIDLYVKILFLFVFFNVPMEGFAKTSIDRVGDTLTGTVIDSNGEPIIGASVVVVGKKMGVSTDIDGKFSFILPDGAKKLEISFIGYKTKILEIGVIRKFMITLDEDNEQLDAVQVVAYGTAKKVTISGAISSVNTEEILKTPASSMGNALGGKLPGLSAVQTTGQPGADNPNIFIRGTETLSSGGSSPLVLVDGVERSFSQIDPNEVANVTVLKDASATAVFGVRGANGVILITTRRGKKGKARINISSSAGVQVPTQMLDFCNSYDYATYYNEAQTNDGVASENLRFSPTILQAFKTHSNPLIYPDTDWMDYLTKKFSFQTQHNINISGGTDRVRYFVSSGFLSQDGMFKEFSQSYDGNFNYKRYNYRANIDFDVTSSTSLAINLGGRVGNTRQPIAKDGDSQLFRLIYWATPFSGAGVVDGKWIKTNPDYIPGADHDSEDGLDPYYGRGYQNTVNNVLNIDAVLNQKMDFITKGLSLKVKGSYNSSFTHYKKRAAALPYYNAVIKDDGEIGFRQYGDDTELNYYESRNAYRNWYAEASLNYKRKFNKHNVTGLVLYNESKNYYPSTYTDIPTGYVGLVGRATYNYDNKYLLDLNVGYNGSENFAPNKRYGLFPAVSGGWIISQEKFMKNLGIISYLKLRASYGVVGNDNLGGKRFLYLPNAYKFGGWGYNFGTNISNNQPGAYEGAIGNQGVTWEKAYKQNYGIDINFFKGKLKVNYDIFFDHRKDILITRNSVPSYTGMSLPAVNYGIVDNHGFEIAIKWSDKIGKSFVYWIDANLSYAKNEIKEMDEVRRNEEWLYRTGRSVGQSFVKKFWGFYDDTANERYKDEYGIDIADHGIALKPGDCVYVDENKDGVIDDDDVIPQGYTWAPEYYGGVTLGAQYHNFSISLLWNYAWNVSRNLAESMRMPLGGTNTRGILQDAFDNRWTPETASTATLPRASILSKANNYTNSDLWLRNSNYLRLKTVEIAYTFQGPWIKRIGANSLKVYTNGYNLLTFDNLKLVDPEITTSNRSGYPLMKIYNLGVKIGF